MVLGIIIEHGFCLVKRKMSQGVTGDGGQETGDREAMGISAQILSPLAGEIRVRGKIPPLVKGVRGI